MMLGNFVYFRQTLPVQVTLIFLCVCELSLQTQICKMKKVNEIPNVKNDKLKHVRSISLFDEIQFPATGPKMVISE